MKSAIPDSKATPSTYAVCKQSIMRDRYGRVMIHTSGPYGEHAGHVCKGSDRGARP